MPEYAINIPVNVGPAAPIRSLDDTMRTLGATTQATSREFGVFKAVVEAEVRAGASLEEALRKIKASTAELPPAVRGLVSEFEALARGQNQAAEGTRTLTREQQKLANEVQKTGRQMEMAYQENARRTQALGRMQELAYQENARRDAAEAQRQTNLTKNLLMATGGSLPGGYAGANLLGQAGGAGALLGAAGIAALVASLAAASKELITLTNETGEYAREQSNLAARTGLTLHETQEFTQMAQIAGINVGSLTTAMRGLSKGMAENSEEGKKAKAALAELGLDSSVAFEPTGRAMKEIFERLGQVEGGFERDRIAIELFGRGGLELLPLIENFKQLEARIDSAGNIMDEAGIKKAKEYALQVSLLSQEWAALRRELGIKAIGVIQIMMGGKDISIGGILDNLVTGGAFGAYRDFIASPGAPRVPHLGGLPDPNAIIKQQRSEALESLNDAARTPRQRLEAQLAKAKSDRDAAGESFVNSNTPGALQKVKDLDKSIASLEARLGAAKKTTESFAEALAHFSNRGDTNEFARRIAENDQQAVALNRRFPGNRAAIESTRLSNLSEINTEAKAEIAKFQAHLESEGEREAEEFYTEQIKRLVGSERDQKQRTLNTLVGDTGLTVEDFAQRYKAGKVQFAGQERAIGDTATLAEQQQQLNAAISGGTIGRLRASGQLTPQQLSGLELSDQLSNILQTANIQTGQYNAQATLYSQRARNTYGDDAEKERLENQASEALAKSKEAEVKATVAAVDAINKFQESAEEASAKLREEFGNFISGLAAAGREGHAGTYARNFLLGQSDKIVSNFAQSMYKPGMFQFPGQGTAQNPTMLGKLFEGTMFGADPMAAKQQPVIKSTDDNTTATKDNTTALAALLEALGYDPSGLGLTSIGSVPQLTSGGAASGNTNLPFFGAAGAAGAAGGVTALGSVLKAAGVSVPGLTTSGGSTSNPWSALTNLFTSKPNSAPGNGFDFSQSGQVSIGGGDGSSDTYSFPSVSSSLSFPALGIGDATSGLPTAMQASASDQSMIGSLGKISFPQAQSTNPFTTLFGGGAGTGQMVGAGLQLGGEAFGAYSGISQAFKGGAQNIMGGIGKTAMSIAPLTGPAAPFVEAGGALLSLVSSLMGDPRAERQAHINHELFNNQYIAPMAINRTMDISGNYSDIDFRGNVRGSDLSSIPIIQQSYEDPRHGVVVPGQVLSPFGGGGPSTSGPLPLANTGVNATVVTSGATPPSVTVINNVSAIDQDSVAKFFTNNPQAMGDGIVNAINKGGTDLANRLRTI